jgi:o-succinylbenzoate synthase
MRIYTYNIPISTQILTISSRQGIVFETEQGFGEAAPLPGRSRETIYDLIAASPSIDFALNCAHRPFPRSFPSIPLCALATNRHEAESALNRGFQTLKIKVGNHSVCDALDLVSRIQRYPVRLRIDVNRRWGFDEAMQFFNRLDLINIEYIEEPTHDLHRWSQLPPIPIALDETLQQAKKAWIHLPNVHALILKPTLLGRRLDGLIQFGKKYGKKLVFSSSFESAIGLLHIAHLQATFSPQNAVGLDTHRFFRFNFLPMPVQNGMLSDHPLPPLDRTWLKEYAP